MDYRQLGGSGLKVPVLSLGTATFGGNNEFFKAFGANDAAGATRLVDVCLDAGLTMFDSADVYSGGQAEAWHTSMRLLASEVLPRVKHLVPKKLG